MELKLAWRNTWRNKRRTFITAASVFTAVILALVMRSAQLGAYQRMIDNVVSFYSGHIQIHKKGYWDEKTLDNSFLLNDTLIRILQQQHSIRTWVSRLESFALSSANDLTNGSMVVGIDPVNENKLTHLTNKIISGSYLDSLDHGVLVAEGLAEKLQLKTGDTLVLLGQGYHGLTAAGKYPVTGIVKFPSPELNDLIVYLTLRDAQQLFGVEDRLTSIAISVDNDRDVSGTTKLIEQQLSDMPYEVMDWKEMMPEMVQLIAVDNAGGVITISILYIIIAFGIFGTILMMLAERRHEFGILVAIGMKKKLLTRIVLLEILIVSGLGVIMGTLAGIPIILYFHINPIRVSGELATAYERFGLEPVFPFANNISIYITQATIVLLLSMILSLYPWLQIMRLRTIEALKS